MDHTTLPKNRRGLEYLILKRHPPTFVWKSRLPFGRDNEFDEYKPIIQPILKDREKHLSTMRMNESRYVLSMQGSNWKRISCHCHPKAKFIIMLNESHKPLSCSVERQKLLNVSDRPKIVLQVPEQLQTAPPFLSHFVIWKGLEIRKNQQSNVN